MSNLQKPAFGSRPDDHTRRNGLVLDLPMLGTGDLQDYSNNGNTGTNNGATWTTGPFGPVLSFGGSEYVELPSGAGQIGSGDFTAVATFYNDTSNAGLYGVVASKSTGPAGGAIGYSLGQNGNKVWWQLDNGSGGHSLLNSSALTMATGWYTVAGVFVNGTFSGVYINGQLLDSSTTSIPSGDLTSGNTVKVGAWGNGSFGYLDEISWVSLFDRALSAQEIKSIYDNPWQDYRKNNIPLWVAAQAPPVAGNVNLLDGLFERKRLIA